MQRNRGRQALTLTLVVVATVFGMVLAGGTHLTPVSFAQTDPAPEKAVVVPAATQTPLGLPSFADLAAAVSPAVVSIQATTIERGGGGGRGIDPFEFFFGPRRRSPRGEEEQQQQQQQQDRRSDSGGSGFVISSDGLIVTNYHVIEGATDLSVHLGDRDFPAEVVGEDPATDLALLKIAAAGPLDYLRLGDSDSLRVGSWLMVIGSPLRLENSVSVGVVSAKGRSINITPDSSLENFIQTDAAINFGNSGGPVVDLEGRVVGIATAINYGAENIGFAVPVATLQQILPQLRDDGAVRRGYLGVEIDELEYEEAQAFGLESARGALVVRVVDDGPAARGGVEHGDIILRVDGREIERTRDLIDYVSSRRPESKVTLQIFRDGKRLSKEVTLDERATPGASPSTRERQEEREPSIEWLGIDYDDLSPRIRSSHGIPEDLEGVWVAQVEPSSPLYDQRLRPGDVIVEVNRQKVASVDDFEKVIEAVPAGSYLRLYVRRFDPRSGNDAGAFFAIIQVP